MILYRAIRGLLWLLRHIWWRWTIVGLDRLPPPGTGMILALNHMHWLDTFVIGESLPIALRVKWLAKAELFTNPLIGNWLRLIGAIPIKRGKRDLQAMAVAEEALQQGAALIIFVEGHRSATGSLQVAQPGAIRLAARTACPIVPIGLSGTENGVRGAFLRQPIQVHIGEPYRVQTASTTIPPAQMDALITTMMLRLAALLPERYWGVYREQMLAQHSASTIDGDFQEARKARLSAE